MGGKDEKRWEIPSTMEERSGRAFGGGWRGGREGGRQILHANKNPNKGHGGGGTLRRSTAGSTGGPGGDCDERRATSTERGVTSDSPTGLLPTLDNFEVGRQYKTSADGCGCLHQPPCPWASASAWRQRRRRPRCGHVVRCRLEWATVDETNLPYLAYLPDLPTLPT